MRLGWGACVGRRYGGLCEVRRSQACALDCLRQHTPREVRLPDTKHYYIGRTTDCWLRVQLERGPVESVPYGLRVRRIGVQAGREHFEILEGVHKGRRASVVHREGHSYLTNQLAHRAGALLRFDRKAQTLHIGGRGPYNAFSGGGHAGYTQVAVGTHLLAIPSHPASQTRAAYSTWTRYHNVWFRIGTSLAGSRFLHPGAISDGCVTVRQFVYDPEAGAPPAGFSDLADGAKTAPGLLGLPLACETRPHHWMGRRGRSAHALPSQ